MNKDKLSSLDISIFANFLFRSYFTIGGINLIINIAKLDSLFSIILGSIIGFIPLLIFIFINNRLQSENIFQKNIKTFPKIISPLLNIILIVTTFLIGVFSLYNITLFINYNLLNDINIIAIGLLLILSIIYLSSRGVKTIIRTSIIILGIFLLITLINIISLVPYTNPINLYPLMTTDFSNIYISSLYHMILISTPLFLLLVIPKKEVENAKKYKKYMIISYIISSIYTLINLILVISILGVELTSILQYPEIMILQKVSLLNFIERIEDILSFKILFDSFFILALSLFYIKIGIIDTFKFKGFKKNYLFDIIVGIIMLVTSIILKPHNIYTLIVILSAILFIHILLMLFIKDKKQ